MAKKNAIIPNIAPVKVVRLSDEKLSYYKELLLDKKEKTLRVIQDIMNVHVNSNGTDETGKNVNSDENASNSSLQEMNIFEVGRQQKLLYHINCALDRVADKSFGVDRVTKTLIPEERLEKCILATTSIDNKEKEKGNIQGNVSGAYRSFEVSQHVRHVS